MPKYSSKEKTKESLTHPDLIHYEFPERRKSRVFGDHYAFFFKDRTCIMPLEQYCRVSEGKPILEAYLSREPLDLSMFSEDMREEDMVRIKDSKILKKIAQEVFAKQEKQIPLSTIPREEQTPVPLEYQEPLNTRKPIRPRSTSFSDVRFTISSMRHAAQEAVASAKALTAKKNKIN
jgi:hypothetical protein